MRDYAELHRQVDDLARASAGVIAPLVAGLVRPASALDVGCGNGVWLEAFRAAGVADILGIDGDYLDPAAFVIPRDRFRAHDLKLPFDLSRRFDLVVSLEVAEHLPPEGAAGFVRDLTRHGDVVLFSAAVPGQGGWHHVHERWQSYWADLFARHGYVRIDAVRPHVWGNPAVAFWYAQNAFLYVKSEAVGRYPALSAYVGVANPWPADMIHPVLFRHKATPTAPSPAKAPLGVREVLTELPAALARFVAKRLSTFPATRAPR